MYNPIQHIKKLRSRLGKPIRPVIELQKGSSVVNIVTETIQTENMIQDVYRAEAWEVHPTDKASAIYIDGVFKGMGFFASEEGVILQVKTDVQLEKEIEVDGKKTTIRILNASFKGLFSKLLDGSIIERGSALKPSMTQTIIYCVIVGLMAFMMGMSYAN